jgi:hypothetical protein
MFTRRRTKMKTALAAVLLLMSAYSANATMISTDAIHLCAGDSHSKACALSVTFCLDNDGSSEQAQKKCLKEGKAWAKSQKSDAELEAHLK